MTEAEWNACADPEAMLRLLWGSGHWRKWRLFASACCRRHWHLLPGPRCRDAILLCERYADGLARRSRLEKAHNGLIRHGESFATKAAHYAALALQDAVSHRHSEGVVGWSVWMWAVKAAEDQQLEGAAQCALLRDIFDTLPFRKLHSADPAWLSWRGGALRGLAQLAYDERCLPAGTLDPLLLTTLAGQLEEAGCTEAWALAHLRSEGPHVRGCWVIDRLLGKD
jgi:hypothetical protein